LLDFQCRIADDEMLLLVFAVAIKEHQIPTPADEPVRNVGVPSDFTAPSPSGSLKHNDTYNVACGAASLASLRGCFS
jgi:hypothetical protein